MDALHLSKVHRLHELMNFLFDESQLSFAIPDRIFQSRDLIFHNI